jgi:YfiR/HmsC-like
MLRRLAILIAVFSMTLNWTASAGAQAGDGSDSSEYLVKAGFIYNFAKFVEWPSTAFAEPDAPIVIGVLGTDPFGDIINHVVEGKKIGTRGFVIRRFKWSKELKDSKDFKDCRILFVSSSEKMHFEEIFEAVKGLPVLTVGETPGFAERGGMIRLMLEDNRVRFEVNVDAAHDGNLNISSRLLTLARIIAPTGPLARKPG